MLTLTSWVKQRASWFVAVAVIATGVTLGVATRDASAQPGGGASSARPYIDITGGNRAAYPLAIAEPLTLPGAVAERGATATVIGVLRGDLAFSGYFDVLNPKGFLAVSGEGMSVDAIDFNKWLQVGAQGLVKSGVEKKGEKTQYTVRVFDVATGKQVFEQGYDFALGQRAVAHRAANDIVRFYTGEAGIFATRIAYVEKRVPGQSAIRMMDYDGAGDTLVYRNGAINILPSWKRDGSALLFTGYLHNNPDLYRVSLANRTTVRVSNRPGINSGAVYSPDGKKIALTLSHGNNSEIYVMDADGGNLTRLTNDWGIDTSPTWSPDGRRIAFVSTRSGRPHLFTMNADGSEQKRLTYVGDYNQEPRWSPRGDWIAFTARDERLQFDLFMISPDDSTKIVRLTQDQGNNESPTWAPNGRYLAFQSTRTGVAQVFIMDANGENQRRVTNQPWRCEQPTWEPFHVGVTGDLQAIDDAKGEAK